LVDLQLQLETELADREKIEAELSDLKQNSAPAATVSENLTPDAITILSQLARQTQKIKNRPGGLGSYSRNFGKLRRQNFTTISCQIARNLRSWVIKED
jgi:hypothetical protein